MSHIPVAEMSTTNTTHSVISIPQKKCLACGTHNMNSGRRYCSKECRQQVIWVLSLSKGLLKIFNTRYAAFSFDNKYVMLDILPVWSKDISRFTYERRPGKKPADDLKELILHSGEEWYDMINNNNSKSYATLLLLEKNHNKRIAPSSIKPDKKYHPRFSKSEKKSIKHLQIKIEELLSDRPVSKIKSAYKKLAKIHHPDMGGNEEKFKKINEAHHQMLLWANNPLFTSRKALIGCWSYDGLTNKWTPPL
ncbi:MAG: DnaJ domain-containing protein [Thermodesulfobacteriota bacterium]|nr:DnaJ domain-containing protein [Thermodesulfobacteriota bacterium]